MNSKNTNPILFNIPDSFETKRIIIRAPQGDDGALVNKAIKESIEELRPWMDWAQQAPTLEESEIISRQGMIHFMERSDLRLYLIHKETGQFIGSSGLLRIDWQARKFEIGYWVNTLYSGQGYVTEAVEGITSYAITELQANRIEIRCDSRNTRSIRIAEHAGFTMEGILRNEKCDTEGLLSSTIIFAKVRGLEY
jgi:RimJ/RimL family protein N-acetyltransferase